MRKIHFFLLALIFSVFARGADQYIQFPSYVPDVCTSAGDLIVFDGNNYIPISAGTSSYVLTSNGPGTLPTWQAGGGGGGGGVTTVGTYDSKSPAANGSTISGTSIYFQSADATHPGMVSTAAQSWAGVKTLSSAPIVSALTASQAVVTNGSKALASLAYTDASTASTLVSRDASKNFSAGTITAALNGNASTATALAADPADCASNRYATTIAANGDLSCAQVSLSAGVTGTLPIGNGGTGATSLAGHGAVVMNSGGTSQAVVAPGASGNFLMSNGTDWTSGLPSSVDTTVFVNQGNGFGSSSNKIRRFVTTVTNTGDVTYADSATLGGTFTIGSDGLYTAYYGDFKTSGGCNLGITKNSTHLTTPIYNVAYTGQENLGFVFSNVVSGGAIGAIAITDRMSAGDVIRAHTDGTCDSTGAIETFFKITKISSR